MNADRTELLAKQQPYSSAAKQDATPWTHGRVLMPALVGGLLLWCCYFPLGWGWLGWVALVPWLSLVRSPARPVKIYLAAFVGGLVFFWSVLQWIRLANPMMYYAWGALATYCACYVALAVILMRRLDRFLSLVVTAPVVWTSLEYLRAHLMTGFPWYFLGHTQHHFLVMIQISDLVGAYGVTFLVVAVNALAFEWLCAWPRFQMWLSQPTPDVTRLRFQTGCAALLLVCVCGYGLWRMGHEQFETGPRVALIQGNIEQRVRNLEATSDSDRDSMIDDMRNQYQALNDQAMALRPELLIWPETSFPDEWWELAPDFPVDGVTPEWLPAVSADEKRALLQAPDWRERLSLGINPDTLKYFRRWPVNVLFGMNARVFDDLKDKRSRRFNSAFLLSNGDNRLRRDRYDKMHLVPFGEYIPLRDLAPWLKQFSPYDPSSDYSVMSGERCTRFVLGKYSFGVLICFEDTDVDLALRYVSTTGGMRGDLPVEQAPIVDFLVNISNDGWFRGSSEHDEHLAICRFRAVECRRSIVRAVNMGISAVVDGSGRLTAMPDPNWEASKRVATVVVANVPIDRRDSAYASWGDVLPKVCWAIVGVGFAVSLFRRNPSPSL